MTAPANTSRRPPEATAAAERHAEAGHRRQVRVLRALKALELVATEEARQLLAVLAKGAPGAWLTEEARMALARLERRGQAP